MASNVRSRLASYESYDIDRNLSEIRREKRKVMRELEMRKKNLKRFQEADTSSSSSSSSSSDDDDDEKNLTEEQKVKLTLLLKDSIKEFCEMTSAHGFLNISKSTSWIVRIAWILLVIVSISYCVYSVTITVVSYFQYGVTTSYSTYTESPTDFPAITICNLNTIDFATNTNAYSYIKDLFKKYPSELNATIDLTNDEKAYYEVRHLTKLVKAKILGDQNITDDYRKSIGFTMDTMLVSCYFNDEVCTASQFKIYYNYEYGNCWMFNYDSDNVKQTSQYGPYSGLRMELFIGNSESQSYYTIKTGAFIIIHNQTNKAPLVNYEGFYVKPGKEARISVKRRFYDRLSAPYSNCRDDVSTALSTDSIYFNKTLYLSEYRQILCYEICFNYEFVFKQCSCYDPSVPRTNSDDYLCQTESELDCVDTMRSNLDSIPLSNTCDAYCPLECDTIQYITRISTSTYPSNYYYNILKTQKGLTDKFTSLSFSVSDLAYSGSGGGTWGRKKRSIDLEESKSEHHIRVKRSAAPGSSSAATTTTSTTTTSTTTTSTTTTSTTTTSTTTTSTTTTSTTTTSTTATSDSAGVTTTTESATVAATTITTTNSAGGGTATTTTNSAGGGTATTTTNSAGGGTATTASGGSLTTTNTGNSSSNSSGGSGSSSNSLSITQLKASMVKFSIFYPDMHVDEFDESPSVTFDTIQGVLGGQFGLYMGFSFLTFLEVVELIVNAIRVTIRYQAKKKLIIKGLA